MASFLYGKTLSACRGEGMTFLTACGAIFGSVASKTLQMEGAYEVRFINMVNGVVQCGFLGRGGDVLFIFMAAGAGDIV